MITPRKSLLAALLPIVACTLSAQVLSRPTVGLELGKKIAARAEAEAIKNKWTMVIAIIDNGGNLVYLERMDGTQLGSIELAQDKAKTALEFKRPTKSFEDQVVGGRNAILSLRNVTAVEGGIPLVVNGEIIGAIGVSGMKSDQDGVVAKAGAESVNQP